MFQRHVLASMLDQRRDAIATRDANAVGLLRETSTVLDSTPSIAAIVCAAARAGRCSTSGRISANRRAGRPI
jgi:protein-disulfide isomerase-like protein with CxxC motif